MKKVEKFSIKTPRGIINVHTIFENKKEANEAGWGLWFEDEKYDIYAKDNRCGAVVER